MPYRSTESTRRRAEQKRDAFLRAGTDLVAAHGFAGAKVNAIARECNVSAGSLYSYFDNREELLAEVFRRAAGHELAVVRQAVLRTTDRASDRLTTLVRTFAGRALRGRRLAWSLLFEPVSLTIERERLAYRRAYADLGENIVRCGIDAGEFALQNVTLASSAVMGAISESLVGKLNPVASDTLSCLSDEAVIHEINAFCLRALGSAAAEPLRG